ncbi:hypothetical protein [Rhodococcus sp. 14-2470-1a]|uniref:hypothetical protein n=1 Tax=Rhodococcus sp. 14-2470-1a TaxID=2023150 RepID=UPI0015C62466|nr:hypothetical protein [Rhodococcus sp. 14-2470-1a]
MTMSGQEDFAARALQMLEQSADSDLDHESRMRLNARAQVYATLAQGQSAQPATAEPRPIPVPQSSSVRTVGRLVLRGAATKDRLSLRKSAQNRMYELLLEHGGVEASETFITEDRCARIAGEIVQGKYGDIDLATETELVFYLGVLGEAQRIVAIDGAL